MVDFLSRFSDPEFIRERIRMCVQSVYFPCVASDWEQMMWRLKKMCWLIKVRWPENALELWNAIEDPACKKYCKKIKDEVVEKNREDQERWFGRGKYTEQKQKVKPPSPKQVEWLKKHGKAVPATAWEASRMLDEIFGKKAA